MMANDVGRCPTGRAVAALQSSQQAVSPVPASIPNADDVRFLGAGPDPRGGFTFSFADGVEGGVIHLMAAHLYEVMGCGTPNELNCVQMEVRPKDCGQAFTLTLQREGGKTPLRLKAEAVQLLRQALEAIETGRREPLLIVRDVIRNYLEDDPASAIEAATAGETGTGSTEGESAVGDSRDAQTPPEAS